MSQSPETPVTGWPEQPSEAAPYPAAEWTGPTGDASAMPQPVYPPEATQVHADPAQMQPAPGGYPEEGTGLPSEFDHLFRGSPQDSRRSIDRQRPAVGGAPGGYQDHQFPAPDQSAQYQPAGYEQAAAYQPPIDAPAFPPEQQYGGHPEYSQAQGYAQPGYGTQGYAGPEYGNPEYQGGEFVGQGGGPGGWGPGDGPATARSRKGWLIGGGIALVAVIGIVYALSSGGGSGTPNAHHGTGATASVSAPTAKDQAAAVYAIIAQSGPLRSAANDAVVEVNGCHDLAAAQNALQTTAKQRQNQADSVAKLNVSLIQNGAQLVQELQQAWSASAQYDNAYASIAGDVQNGCKPGDIKKDPNYATTSAQGSAASQAKVQAAELWNTNVAGPLGQQQISEAKL